MAPHSSTLAWKIPQREEPGGLQSMGSLRVRHDWATSFSLFTFRHWRRKWQPTPVFSPGESQGRGSLVGCHLWGCTELDTTERLHFHFSLSGIGEGNGSPHQYSRLENPREGEAWWAAIYGVAQSRTRLKRLSNSSRYSWCLVYNESIIQTGGEWIRIYYVSFAFLPLWADELLTLLQDLAYRPLEEDSFLGPSSSSPR